MTEQEQFEAAFPQARVKVEQFDYGAFSGVQLDFGEMKCGTRFKSDIPAAIERLRAKIAFGPCDQFLVQRRDDVEAAAGFRAHRAATVMGE